MANQNFSSQTKAFFDRIFEEAGFQNLSPALKEKMYQDLTSRLSEWLFQDTKKHLSKEQLKKFEDLVAQGASQEELQAFLLQNIPDCQNIIAQSMLNFKDTFLRGVKRGK